MGRLAQTEGLTDIQQEILQAVRDFVDGEIIPNAQRLEHADEYPADIVEGMRAMGIFGLMIPEEYGGLGESLLTYALCVEEIARVLRPFLVKAATGMAAGGVHTPNHRWVIA